MDMLYRAKETIFDGCFNHFQCYHLRCYILICKCTHTRKQSVYKSHFEMFQENSDVYVIFELEYLHKRQYTE